MVVAKICKDGCTDSRPIMWIDAGHHADDWVGPATLMYMIRELVENSSEHPELTEKLDWYLIPTLNPDGYTYTRTNCKLHSHIKRFEQYYDLVKINI
jgi:murein tripeptide amidase MpaA